MSFFQPQVSFPLDFATSSSVMINNSSEIFLLKHYMLWTKMYNFSNFIIVEMYKFTNAKRSLS